MSKTIRLWPVMLDILGRACEKQLTKDAWLACGQFKLNGLGEFVQVVEILYDDTYIENPFEDLFTELEARGIHIPEDQITRGFASDSGRFILLPNTVQQIDE